MPEDLSPVRTNQRKALLYEFIHEVDKEFPVLVSRLPSLPSPLKVNLGGLFIAKALAVYWDGVVLDENEEFRLHLLDWIATLVDLFLGDVMACTADESTALKQVLIMSIPPYVHERPELPSTESMVTFLSRVQNNQDEDQGPFISFLEHHACVAPLCPVVWLRDTVVLLVLQSSEENRVYNSRTRETLFRIADSLALDSDAIRMWERSIGEILHGSEHMSETQASVSGSSRRMHNLKIGLGAVGGAVLLGVTGGLAFPVIASVVSGVGAALTGIGLGFVGTVFAATSMVLGSISVAGAVALFGITGGSLVTYKLSNRFGNLNLRDFQFKEVKRKSKDRDHSNDALEVVVCVSGYLRDQKDFIDPWKCIRRHNGGLADIYALQWEKANLSNLSTAFGKLLSTELATALTNTYLQISLGAVGSVVALPISIISSMSELDNILIVCENRAKQAGEALSEAVSNPTLGARPYSLIAYSVGASAVFSCLEHLANTKRFSCVQNVILIGSTIPCTFLYGGQKSPWQRARSVVAGRFINVYSKKDMLLQVLCRYLQWSIQVSGVSEVQDVLGVENHDVSDIITNHSQYPAKIGEILSRIGYIH